MAVGVLAFQGCVEPHLSHITKLGERGVAVRTPEELAAVDRLIIPGGESTTMLRLINRTGFEAPLREFASKKPIWGICAGAILIAKKVSHPEQFSFGFIDIHAVRNFYGSQQESFTAQIELPTISAELEVDFIRAPKLTTLGGAASVLARYGDDEVLFQQGRILASSFHSELRGDSVLHRYFLSL